MSDFKIEVNVAGVVRSEKIIKRSFENIRKEALSVDKSLGIMEKGIDQVNKGLIDARSFNLRYAKAVSTVKKTLKDSYGEHKGLEKVLIRTDKALKSNVQNLRQQTTERNKSNKAAEVLRRKNAEINKSMVVLSKGIKKLNKGLIDAKTFNLRYAKALSTVKKGLRDSYGANKKYEKSINSVTKAINKSVIAKNKSIKSSKGLFGTLTKQVLVANLAAAAIQKTTQFTLEQIVALKKYSDEWIKITNIIKLGVKSEEDLISSRQRILDISQETRTDMMAQTTLYNRLTLSQKELGASQEEIIGVIRGVGHALGVTATSALESRGSLIQLAQAFGQPIVRAEEFNSILEGTPRIAKALADGFGLTRSGLRKLVLAGKVTNKEFFQALRSQLPLLEQEFRNVAPTIDQSLTVIKNGMRAVVGQFNELTGVAPAVASGFVLIGKGLTEVSKFIANMVELTSEKTLSEQLKSIDKQLKEIENFEKINYEKRLLNAEVYGKELKRIQETWVQGFVPQEPRRREGGFREGAKRFIEAGLIKEIETPEESLTRRREEVFIKLKEEQIENWKKIEGAAGKEILKDRKEFENNRLKIAIATFKSTGFIGKEEFNLYIQLLKDKRDANIKAGNDTIAEENAFQKKYKEIREKAFGKTIESLDEIEQKIRVVSDIWGKAFDMDYGFDEVQASIDEILLKRNNEALQLKKSIALQNALAKAAEDTYNIDYGDQSIMMGIEADVKQKSVFEKYIEDLHEAANATTTLEDITMSAFNNMEDAIVDFVMKGKFEFKSFALSIIEDMARIEAKRLSSAILGGDSGGGIGDLFKGLLSGLGGGSGYMTPTGGGPGTMWPSFDTGGSMSPTGTKKPFPAIVHSGEVIGTPNQMSEMYGGGDEPKVTNIYINAIDTQTFNDYVRKNPEGIITAVDDNISGGGQLRGTIGGTL